MIGANKYTTPRLLKGTKPTTIPKGSSLEKELAKNVWYVNYSFNGKQYRIKGDLNRIKDPKDKAYQAEVLLRSIKNDLENGYNPERPDAFIEELAKQNISLKEAVDKYLLELETYARKNTVDSYQSKLRHLVVAYADKQVKDITTNDLEKFIHGRIHTTDTARMFMNGKWIELDKVINWTPATVKAARGVFKAFFNWCKAKENQYIAENPAININDRKVRSEIEAQDRNIPFTKEDMQTLMNYFDANDKFTAFFCRFIYSTCLRPKEISELKIKDVDLANKQIAIPLATTKNTKRSKVDRIDIEPNFWQELEKLNLSQYPKDYFITSNAETIVGAESIGDDKPYKRFRKGLEKLNLHQKGYSQYSFKHFSNVQRLNSGWTLAEIMKANRHSSISTTEKYLKDITRSTDISKKEVPAI